MSIMTRKQFSSAIKRIKTSRISSQAHIQETLISATFYAMRDGNATTFSQILEGVGNAYHVKGITMWAELNAPVLIRDGAFVMNKTAAKDCDVTCEADFEQYEVELRASVPWYEVSGKQAATSIFNPMDYMKRVADKLTKEGFADLATAVRAAKGKFEMDLIKSVEEIDLTEEA